jgi:hypothetical protein
MAPFDTGDRPIRLICLPQKGLSRAPFQDLLIICAGTGNNIDHALRYGVDRIDAVEINPSSKRRSRQRLLRHLDDGRHFPCHRPQIRFRPLCAGRFKPLAQQCRSSKMRSTK